MSKVLNFQEAHIAPTLIKVIGVGGGGGNAVTHMYNTGIEQVTFALCNTDNQALYNSPIPIKIQLGVKTTEGLGAGNNPEKARLAALESEEDIRDLLQDGTKMVFITAGMGGGTGTGASPVVARIAYEMGILTVGIVTIPFAHEGEPKIIQAFEGIEALSKNVDAILVLNNERLIDLYSNFKISEGFRKADDTLTVAAKGIADIINYPGYINLDFADVHRTLKDGGIAIMSTGYGDGQRRTTKAFDDAMNSPLLHNSDIYNATKLLINIFMSHDHEVTLDELEEFRTFIQQFGFNYELIWGTSYDDSLGDKVKVIVLATGYSISDIPGSEVFIERKSNDPFDAIEQKRKEEKVNNYRKKIANIYGPGALTGFSRNNFIPILLNEDQINDDEIIEWMSKMPINKRDKYEVQALIGNPIPTPLATNVVPAPNVGQVSSAIIPEVPSGDEGIISF